MKSHLLAGLALALVIAATVPGTRTFAAREWVPSGLLATEDIKEQHLTIKDIMKKAHGGKTSLYAIVWNDIHRDPPNWQRSRKNLAEMIRLCNLLTERKPPKGTQESWEKLVQAYLDHAKTVQENLEKENVAESRTTYDKLLKTCKVCHNAHDPGAGQSGKK
jgi:hypothetical protein